MYLCGLCVLTGPLLCVHVVLVCSTSSSVTCSWVLVCSTSSSFMCSWVLVCSTRSSVMCSWVLVCSTRSSVTCSWVLVCSTRSSVMCSWVLVCSTRSCVMCSWVLVCSTRSSSCVHGSLCVLPGPLLKEMITNMNATILHPPRQTDQPTKLFMYSAVSDPFYAATLARLFQCSWNVYMDVLQPILTILHCKDCHE